MVLDGATGTDLGDGDTDIGLGDGADGMVDMDMVMPAITDIGDTAPGAHPMAIIPDTITIRTGTGTMRTIAPVVATRTERTISPITTQEMPYVPIIIGRARPQGMCLAVPDRVRTEVHPPEAHGAIVVTEAVPAFPEERLVSTATGRTGKAEVHAPHPITIARREVVRATEVPHPKAVRPDPIPIIPAIEARVREPEAVAVPTEIRAPKATRNTEARHREVAATGLLRAAAPAPEVAVTKVPEAVRQAPAAFGVPEVYPEVQEVPHVLAGVEGTKLKTVFVISVEYHPTL